MPLEGTDVSIFGRCIFCAYKGVRKGMGEKWGVGAYSWTMKATIDWLVGWVVSTARQQRSGSGRTVMAIDAFGELGQLRLRLRPASNAMPAAYLELSRQVSQFITNPTKNMDGSLRYVPQSSCVPPPADRIVEQRLDDEDELGGVEQPEEADLTREEKGVR
jgi:hypothetical protein